MRSIRKFLFAGLLLSLLIHCGLSAQEKAGPLIFQGHTDAIYSVALSSDGKLLATGSFDRSVRLWDAINGKELRKFSGPGGHQSLVLSVAMHPNGALLASGGSDNNLFLWDVPSPNAIKEFQHSSAVNSISVTADGKSLAAFGKDGSTRLWSLADGKQLVATPPGLETIAGTINSTGQVIVSAGKDGFLRWTNAADGKPTSSIGTTNGQLTGLASSGNSAFTIADDGQLKFWQASTITVKPLPAHTDSITQLLLTGDSSGLITIGNDKVIKSVSANSGTLSKEFTAPNPISSVALFPNGSIIAIGQPDGKIIFWNRTEGKVIETLQAGPKKITRIAVNPSGNAVVSISEDNTAQIWAYPIVKPKPAAKDAKDPGEIKPTATFKIPGGELLGVLHHPSANQILTISTDKSVRLLDLPTGKEARLVVTLPQAPKAFTISRDFASLAVSLDKTVKVFNLADGKETLNIPLTVDATSLNFNSDKTRLVTGHSDKIARIWDVAKGQFIHSVEHSGPITGVAFAPSQQGIFVSSSDKTGAILPIQQPKIVPVSTIALRAVTLFPNQTHLLVGGDDPVVKAINVSNGNEEKKFEGAEGPVYAIAGSKNAQVVAIGGADKTIRLFQFNDARPIATIPAKGIIRALAFHPLNNMLVSITEDRIMTAWNVAQQQGQPLPDDFGSVIQQWTLPEIGTSAAFTEKGDLFVGLADKTVKQYRIALNTPFKNVLQHPNLIDSVAFSTDGKFLASGCHDGILRIFDTEKWALGKAIQAHTTPAPPAAIYSVVWSPDSKQILSTSFDKSMKLWDATSGTLVREFKGFTMKTFEKGHQDQVFTAIFTKDGKTLISGSSDRQIKKWNVADGNVIGEFPNPNIKGEPGQSHPGGIYGLRLSADEKLLISVGPAPKNHGYLATWSLADGKLLSGSEVNSGPIYSATLTSDGKGLIVGCGPKIRQEPVAEALVLPLAK